MKLNLASTRKALSRLSQFSSNTRSAQRRLFGIAPLAIALATGLAAPSYAVEFPNTGDRGAPSRTAGGGTRSEWCEGMTWTPWSAAALVPSNNVSTFAGEQASLWMYVSEGFNEKSAEIYVQDPDTRATVYEGQLELTGLTSGGLVKVDLPATGADGQPLLESDKDYYWEFSIICNARDRAQDYIVQGLLNRVDTSDTLLTDIASAAPQDQLEQFARAGLWQETLQTSAALQTTNPAQWAELLTSVGLEILLPELSGAQSGQAVTDG